MQKILVPRIIVANDCFNVEYEGLKLICFACGRYGHRREACPWKAATGNGKEDQPQKEGSSPERKLEIAKCQDQTGSDSESRADKANGGNFNGETVEDRTEHMTGSQIAGQREGQTENWTEQRQSKMPITPETFGPWMLVGRQGQQRPARGMGRRSDSQAATRNVRGAQPAQASRFGVLAETEKHEEEDAVAGTCTNKEGFGDENEKGLESHSWKRKELARLVIKGGNKATKKKNMELGREEVKSGPKGKDRKAVGQKEKLNGLKGNNENGPMEGQILRRMEKELDMDRSPRKEDTSGKGKGKMLSQRTHCVVSGNIGQMPKKNESQRKQQDDMENIINLSGAEEDEIRIGALQESLNPKPPDPVSTNAERDEELMEDARTELGSVEDVANAMEDEDHLEDFDFVPDTGATQ